MTAEERINTLTSTLVARDREIAGHLNMIQYLETANERLIARAEAAEAQLARSEEPAKVGGGEA